MKVSRRIFALVLALVMVFSTCVTAFADDPTGKITVKNATERETYAAFMIFNATVDATDNTKIAYEISDSSPWYSVVTSTDGAAVFTLNAIPGKAGYYNVVLKEGKEASVIGLFKDHFSYNEASKTWTNDVNATAAASVTAAAGAQTAELSPLPYGYYFVTSTLGAVISVDSVNTAPEIVDKNQNPSWDNETPEDPKNPNPGKVIVEGTAKLTASEAKFGERVNFDIGVNATNFVNEEGDVKQVTYYLIADKLAAGFAEPTDFKVIVNGVELTSDKYVLLTDGNNFEVNIPWATVTSDAGKVTAIASLYPSKSTIHVTYSAVLTDEATIAGNGNKNIANFTYLTDEVGEPPVTPPGDPEDPENPNDDPSNPFKKDNKRETTTYTYALGITKVDGESKAKLAGATFSLNTRTGDAEPYTYTKVAAVYVKDGYYKIPDGDPAAPETTTSFVTNADGVLVIEGLDETTYYFIEEDAPDGYNLLTEAVPVQAQLIEETTYTTSYTTYFDKDGKEITKEEYEDLMNQQDLPEDQKPKLLTRTYEVNTKEVVVENNKGVELPSTGGMGTGIFYLLGAVLLAGGAVLLGTKKHIGADR